MARSDSKRAVAHNSSGGYFNGKKRSQERFHMQEEEMRQKQEGPFPRLPHRPGEAVRFIRGNQKEDHQEEDHQEEEEPEYLRVTNFI